MKILNTTKSIKIYLLTILAFFSVNSYAQCTPDPNWDKSGISPSRLPNGIIDSNYSTILSFKTPKDTSIIFSGQTYNATIDSAKVEQIINYPIGFNWACNNSSCTWKGGEKGCALLQGKPDSTHFNHYIIKIYVRSWISVKELGFPIERLDSSTIDYYITGGKNNVQNIEAKPLFKIFPNPVNNILQIELLNLSYKNTQLIISDLTGKNLLVKTIASNISSIDITNLPKGMHFITLKNNNLLYTQKLIIE